MILSTSFGVDGHHSPYSWMSKGIRYTPIHYLVGGCATPLKIFNMLVKLEHVCKDRKINKYLKPPSIVNLTFHVIILVVTRILNWASHFEGIITTFGISWEKFHSPSIGGGSNHGIPELVV